MQAKLILEDGTIYEGRSFGSPTSAAGEVVFNTGMVGYPECFTDPSYTGQIVNLTYPLIGNYGVPQKSVEDQDLDPTFESDEMHIWGLVVSEFSEDYSHWSGVTGVDKWLEENGVPGISGIDTRRLTQKLREQGAMLGKIVSGEDRDIDFVNPNSQNLVAQVSPEEPREFGDGDKKVLLLNCGAKFNIIRSLLKRGVAVKSVPWDWDISKERFDGLLISNGPGDPRMVDAAVRNVRKLLQGEVPIFGICLGNQILARAAGAETYKLKYGHRGQNQPCIRVGTKRCFITSQNHGFAVDERTLPEEWEPWFFNANDGTNEGVRHKTQPFFSVQFHPEASPGPLDTEFLFDEFIQTMVN